jgi:hypothetical protein
MKMKSVSSIIAPLVIACGLVAMVAATAAGQGTQGGRIQGTWETQITLNDCAGHVIRIFQGMLTFQQGGTLMEGTNTSALKTPGEGVWRLVGGNTYGFRFKNFNFNAQNVYTGWSIIAGELTVDSTGNAFAGSGGSVQVYDPNGNLVATLCADSAGTRFEL